MSRGKQRSRWLIGTVAGLGALLSGPAGALADSSPLLTGHPDLVAAQAISATQVLACFDQILNTPFNFTDASFFLQGYAETSKTGAGSGLTLSSETATGGGFCVVALFTGAGDARTYSRLVVLANAVTASVPGGGGAANAQNSVALLGGTNGGATSGPDLTSFQINKSTGYVSFVFDSAVSSAAAVAPLSFHLVDKSANLTAPPSQGGSGLLNGTPAGPQFTVSPANTVNVNFSAPSTVLGLLPGPPDLTGVRAAVGVSVDEGAVKDAAGVVNPLASLGVTPPATPAPTGPKTPPAPPVPTLSTPTPTTTPPAVAKTCRRVLTLHLLTSVSSKLRAATATINGKRVTVSRKFAVTISFAKYPSVKSIVVRIKGKLRSGHSFSAAKTYKNKC